MPVLAQATPATMAVDPRLTKILMTQANNYMKDPHPNLLCVVDEQDCRIWYFLAGGLEPPFLYGEYIIKITAPDDFPHKPPRFEVCTANGVYECGGPICISIGEYHSNQWRASLGMAGFVIQGVTGMTCFNSLGDGIRIKVLPDVMKSSLAKVSRKNNEYNYMALCRRFEEVIEAFPESAPVRNITDARLKFKGVTPPPRIQAPPVITSRAEAPPRADNLEVDVVDPESETVAPEPVPAPEAPEPVPEAPEPEPVSAPEPAPEAPEPVPVPAPEAPEPVPEAPEPVPEAPEPVPEAPEPVPEAPEPVPEAPEPVPEPVPEAPEPAAVSPELTEDSSALTSEAAAPEPGQVADQDDLDSLLSSLLDN